ncbi:MAG: A24 family peptidase, partial [Candidatus Sungiibacteriota bacterium]
FGGFSNLFWYASGLLFYFLAATLLLGIGIYDFRTKIIAPALMWPFFILASIGLAVQWFSGAALAGIAATVIAALLVFIFFAGLWFFSKGRAMGFGDAELAPAIVLFLGPLLGVAALLFAFWLGAIFGILLIALGRARLKSDIPFGPFLVAGAFVALFWGEAFLRAYFAIFL